MILDNSDDVETFFSVGNGNDQLSGSGSQDTNAIRITEYIPDCSHGSILVTTRNKAAGIKLTKNRGLIQVSEMSETESNELVRTKLDGYVPSTEEVNKLTNLLEQFPLALVQAASFMQENSITVSEYLELYNDGDEMTIKLLSEAFEESGRDPEIQNAVAATWMISFNQIRKQNPRAAQLLSLMAFFDRQGIAKSLLQQDDESPLELTKALGMLKAFSLITESQSGKAFDIHRLVQLVTHKWLLKHGEVEYWVDKALKVVSDLYPDGDFENWEICALYLPHAQAVIDYSKQPITEAELRSDLLVKVAIYLWGKGLWKEAEELEVQAIETRKRVLGKEHPDTLTSIGNLAATFRSQGRWEEAEELELQVVEAKNRVLGEEHQDTLTSMSNLALTFWSQGRWEEAEELGIQVLESRKRVLGVEHQDTLTSMSNLALTFWSQGRWEEAEELGIQVLESRKRVLGEEHQDTLLSMHNLSFTLKSQARDEEALALMGKCVDLRKVKLGVDHPDTKVSLRYLEIWRSESASRSS